jgi:putative ABC transport system permease protein
VSVHRLATRIYAGMLHAFPRQHRHSYGAEMIDAFERELAARMRAGNRWSTLGFVLAAWLNAIGSGIGERERHRRVRYMSATWLAKLDVILAWRMLVRYPGLSIVGVFAMSVGIAVAAGASTIVAGMINPTIPLPEGERLVSLVVWDASTNNREPRLLHDFAAWREMTSLDDIGAFRGVERNLIAAGAAPEPVNVTEISAAAFRAARVAPLLGRHLLPEDERPGAPDAVVIGHREWVRRFGADPSIVGQSLQLGDTAYAIVGVMPDGFQFPVNDGLWIPWRLDPSGFAPRTGPEVAVFARLAPGATLASAQAELGAIGRNIAAASPATHEHLRPNVVPYAYGFSDMDNPENAIAMRAIQALLVLLLLVIYVNVAILVYARTATREGEIAVRSALGASRRRIVAQLFAEALMLAGVAAAIGIGLLSFGFRFLDASLQPLIALPFWMTLRLSATSAFYVATLTLLAAAIVGIIPALKATGLRVQGRLQGLSAGSGSRMQMGGLWTLLIVAQVGLTVAVLPGAMVQAFNALRLRSGDDGFASSEFLRADLSLDRAPAAAPNEADERAFRSRFAAKQAELDRRLREEPAVRDVTFSMAGPGHELALVLEVEGMSTPADPADYNIVAGSTRGHLVRFNRVAPGFFTAFEVPVLTGRNFTAADTRSDAVLVNRAVVDAIFGGSSPLGRRIRYVGRSQEASSQEVNLDRWFEVVGVVPDFPVLESFDTYRPMRVYHAAALGDIYPVVLGIRARGSDAGLLGGRLREIGAEVDPTLQLHGLWTTAEGVKREQGINRLIGVTIMLVMLSVVILSAAGIYALMSFTVARRRREIGIRAALGANPNRVLAGIFSRALGQLGIGAAVGFAGAVGLEQLAEGEMFLGQGAVLLPIVAVFMTIVGLLAAIGPARRGLSIQPTEALREE